MQKHDDAAGAKSPNPMLYALLIPPLRLYLRLRYGYKKPKGLPVLPEDGAFVVLGSHASNLDFLFTVAAICPHRPNAVVTEYFFGEAALAWLLRSLHAIPRKQFVADPASVRAMLKTTRRGGCLLLYPEGEVNGTGRFDRMPPGLGKLCKLLGAPVYTAVTQGSYLSYPKWARAQRRGRAGVRLELAADAETLKSMDAAQLDALLCEKLHYDDFTWQRENRIAFRGKNLAEHAERILYRCPKCGAEGKMQSANDKLFCMVCGNAAVLDAYGFFHKEKASDVIFETVAEWTQYQRETLRAEACGFCMKTHGALLVHQGGGLTGTQAGQGMIVLDEKALSYTGERFGEQVQLVWSLDSFYKLSFGAGRDFGVPALDGQRLFLKPENPQLVEKFVLAVNMLHDLQEESNQKQ